MLLFVLKSSACLAVFMIFYKLCLEKTSAHTFKRFYLIGVILISISIPLITFTEYIELSKTDFENALPIEVTDQSKTFYDLLPVILWSIYVLGLIIFLFRFFKNIYRLFQKIKTNPKLKSENFINVLLNDLIIPHTFLNYIFLNKTKYENKLIPDEVLLHEQIHAKQKHALDILFVELFQILFWFNPLLYFIKKDIKLNHEFLADHAVLKQGIDSSTYQKTLLTFSSPNSFRDNQNQQIVNAINYSLIKKRFTVMKTKTSKTIIWLRSLIILPLLAILIYSFSNKAIIETENTTEQSVYQKKATQKEIAEYNRLAKKYNNPQGRVIIKNKEVERLNYIYRVMTVEQRKKAEPFPVFPPPPPVPGEPSKLRGVVEVPAPEPTPVKVVEVREVPAPVEVREVVEVPPPPPPPKSPLEHVKDMAKKGAKFYYNKKEISSKKAISILTKNKNISITTNHSNDNDYVVQLSTKPIVIKED
ncbi:M56 family metallopeptidase [Jejuia spongiicola]|uniref:M56 family metallopeptidase n=1 Tax=Jejuia spongiicola TaxID=2942207 RepID=A0ABT0QAM8_9FLAO|nr:M56 family metallopeptidase [Jejuia spongiicola]MCL6293983.1 M56 family metallopeptidase [Jejuia spongiicola]